MSVRGEAEEQKEEARIEAGEFEKRNVEEKREKRFSIDQRERIRISVQSWTHLVDASVRKLVFELVPFVCFL